MKYIVFTRYPHNITPISEWIRDVIQDTIIVTKESLCDNYSDKFHTIGLKDYDSDLEKFEIVKSICVNNDISHIGALSETDIIPVAKCREIARVSGQSSLSAITFRNKLVMKKMALAGEIPIPKHRLVGNVKEVQEFVSLVGFPIVIKPIDGAGSVSTNIIKDESELSIIGEETFSQSRLVEQFVSEQMVHANGFF